MDRASLAQWLAWLETLHPNPIDLGLERVARVARTLRLLPVAVPVVTVAGTNGKGSTVAVLEAILGQTGRRAGVYTSPHLLRFNERIRVGGIECEDAEIVAAFKAIDAARGDTSLTYFEFATLAALLVFRARAVDVIVLEVGLGGRLDAVNIVDPSVAVITGIDLDHQDWLGSDRGTIAREKGGIMRSGAPVVIADPDPPAQLLECARSMGAVPILRLGGEFSFARHSGLWQGVLRDPRGQARVLPELVAGPLMPENICGALQAALFVGCEFDDGQLVAALDAARPRGRCESVSLAGRDYVLDVAHNPASVKRMVEYLSVTPCKGKTYCVFSVMKDKDVRGMIQAAGDCFDEWFIAEQPGNARAARGADVAAVLWAQGVHRTSVSEDPGAAFRRALAVMEAGDRLVTFGSFYTVAGVMPLLDRERNKVEA